MDGSRGVEPRPQPLKNKQHAGAQGEGKTLGKSRRGAGSPQFCPRRAEEEAVKVGPVWPIKCACADHVTRAGFVFLTTGID